MSPNEASAGNEFSSAIGKHSSDSSRGVKVVRHVHRVAPFDIFPRAPFSRITIGTRGEEEEGGFSPTEAKNFSVSLYIYIYISFLETSTKRRGRAFSSEFRWKEEKEVEKEELLMAESLHADPRRLNCLGGE